MATVSQIKMYQADPERVPRSRRELLWFIWGHMSNVNVFKEGAYYAIRVGRVISATHIRCINHLTKEQWLNLARGVPKEVL